LYFPPVRRRGWQFSSALRGAFGLALLCGLGGCDEGPQALAVTVVKPLKARVGEEVTVPLAVLTSEPLVTWDWRSHTNPELATRLRRPSLTVYTRGRAVWRWTPVAEDIGEHVIEFFAATDRAQGSAELSLSIDSGIEAPVFREPVGEGTTLDLRSDPCARIDVVVESTATPRVELSLLEPRERVLLLQTGDFTADLTFCPTPQQIALDTVYPLTIRAVAESWTIHKNYVIVLRRP
jgi:hypothetical protein